MQAIEDAGVLQQVLQWLGPTDLARAGRVRRGWRFAAADLFEAICVGEFPVARSIHAAPGCRKSWLQLYGEMKAALGPPKLPKLTDYKCGVAIFIHIDGNPKRLVHTGVYDIEDELNWTRRQKLRFDLSEQVHVDSLNEDSPFTLVCTVLRAKDFKPVVAFEKEEDGDWLAFSERDGYLYCCNTGVEDATLALGTDFRTESHIHFEPTDGMFQEISFDVALDYITHDSYTASMFRFMLLEKQC